MRITVVQETDWLKRGPHQQHHLFERLAARGHDVTVLDFEILYEPFPRAPLIAPRQIHSNVMRTLTPSNGVTVIRPFTIRLPLIARPISLVTFYFEFVQQSRPDVIVNYALSTGLPAIIAARQRKTPFLFHVIDSLYTLVPSLILRPVAKFFEHNLLRASDRTLYINEELRQYGMDMGAKESSARTIRSGVDLQRFGSGVETASLRSRLGFKSDDVILLFIGWLYDHVGVDTVMRTLPCLPANVKLLVVGAGEGEPQLKALHQELNLGERVVFAGSQPYDSMPRFMAMADVCLLYFDLKPITQHIVPIKIYEYMASGKPVLASPLPAVMRDVPPNNGVLYIPQTELLNELNHLLDSNYRQSIGNQSRKFVEENCDWEKLTDDFEKLLMEMKR